MYDAHMRINRGWQREAFSRDRTDGGGGADDATDDDFETDDEPGDDDDEPDDGDDDGDDGSDGDGDDEPLLNDKGEPFTKKDLDALQTALRNARREARQARRSKPKDGKDDAKDGKDGDDKDTPDADRIRAEAENAAMATWKPLIVNERARSALKDAGLIGDPGRVLRLLDMDDIEVELNDKGAVEVDGLTEQVEDLRKDYPHLFRRRGSSRINAADKDGANDTGRRKTRSASEIQAAALLGRD